MSKEVVLTGLRTNAEYHLGNYLGAIKPMVDLVNKKLDEYQINIFTPDLHSFTTEIDHKKFNEQTKSNIKLFVACGIPLNHENVYIYRQSRISAHSELTIILNNFSYIGELSRMTEYKDKTDRNKTVTVGLFDYPVLMASDILLYDAVWVPVGEDQRQHLEFTRNLAERFNNKFGEIFIIPETISNQQKFINRDSAPRIRSLRNPDKKMSKSVSDPAGTIQLSDSPEQASKKIMSATTDSIGVINYNWENQPGITNLLQILYLLSDKSQEIINKEWSGKTHYGDLKKAVSEIVCQKLEVIQSSIKSISNEEINIHLEASEKLMSEIANNKLISIQKAIGLR